MVKKKLTLLNCEPLLQQIKARFSSWSAKSLSFSGRFLLNKTVIAGITTFWCSSFILPKAKEQGGLGIKDLHSWNRACILKLIWLLFFRPDYVWVCWFKEVILKGSLSNYWSVKTSTSHSWLANKLIKSRKLIYPLIKRRIGNGLSSSFWFDNWSLFGNLNELLKASTSRLGIPKAATLGSLHQGGRWLLPHSRSETFGPLVGNSHRAVVWCPMGIPRHSFLMWLVVLDRCPTKDRLLRWGLLGVNPICLLCNSQPESRDHLFFQCCYSETVWRAITLRCQFPSL